MIDAVEQAMKIIGKDGCEPSYFKVVISSTADHKGFERREKLTALLTAADIKPTVFDLCPPYNPKSESTTTGCNAYRGCDLHFADIIKKYKDQNIIYLEDDAYFDKELLASLTRDLNELTDYAPSWQIFIPGHCSRSEGKTVAPRIFSPSWWILGTQCIVLKAGSWVDDLHEAIVSRNIYSLRPGEYKNNAGFDSVLLHWCKDNDVKAYVAEEPYVWQ